MPKEKVNFVLQLDIKKLVDSDDAKVAFALLNNREVEDVKLFKSGEELYLEYEREDSKKCSEQDVENIVDFYKMEIKGERDLRFLNKKEEILMDCNIKKNSSFGIVSLPNPNMQEWSLLFDKLATEFSSISGTLSIRAWKRGWFAETPTSKELDKKKLELGIAGATYPLFGFSLHHWFIIPPQNINSEDYQSHFENNEIFLQAPVYEAKTLPSGATLIKLCKDFIWDKVDEEYIKNWIKLYYFLMEHKIK